MEYVDTINFTFSQVIVADIVCNWQELIRNLGYQCAIFMSIIFPAMWHHSGHTSITYHSTSIKSISFTYMYIKYMRCALYTQTIQKGMSVSTSRSIATVRERCMHLENSWIVSNTQEAE